MKRGKLAPPIHLAWIERDGIVESEAGLNSEFILFASGLIAEASLILLLVRKRFYRRLPAFFLFVCLSLVSDSAVYWASAQYPHTIFLRIYILQLAIGAAMMFAVLVELAWSLLRPIRSSLPRYGWAAIALMIALAGALVWPLAHLAMPQHLAPTGAFFFQLDQTIAILRVLLFLGMAGFSQLFSVGWRDRELQLATGLGLYSLVSLAVMVLHVHQIVGPQYHWLDQMDALSYLAVLCYWCVAFSAQEVERQEFTPQMRELLLAAAGAARSTRIALVRPARAKSIHRD